jgi:hypothetical protein
MRRQAVVRDPFRLIQQAGNALEKRRERVRPESRSLRCGLDVALYARDGQPRFADRLGNIRLGAGGWQDESDAARDDRGRPRLQRAREALVGVEQRLDLIAVVQHQQHVARQREPVGDFLLEDRPPGLRLQLFDAGVEAKPRGRHGERDGRNHSHPHDWRR